MSKQSAFDRQHIEESAVIESPGLLDQLNLPPELITFLRKYQRTLWIVTGCIAMLVVTAALYNQYAAHREEKASAALTAAMKEDGTKKQELLVQVVEEYGATASGLWGRLELAHLDVEQGKLDKAIQEYNDVKSEISAESPAMPLILFALGALYEKNNEMDKAVASFDELSTYKGFAASSYEAMGRLYEQQGQKGKAVEMYKKALAPNPEAGPLQSANPNKETIKARINYLQD